MKMLFYGAGVVSSVLAARLHEAGQDVTLLARGARLTALREHGVRLAPGCDAAVRSVGVPVVDRPADGYDLIAVPVRTHQVDAVLESLAPVSGDVLFLLNWAAGAAPLDAVLGTGRTLLGFPNVGGTMDGDVVRHRPPGFLTRRVAMPIGEPDGRPTPRLARIVHTFRTAGLRAKPSPHMDAWLRTHAAFEVPLGRAVHAAGGPAALADDPAALRATIHHIRRSLAALPAPPAPRTFGALHTIPEAVLVPVLRHFLRSRTATHSGLSDTSPTAAAEYDHLIAQLHAATETTRL
ncbi:2-dehydropantoate 2-reductase N-terminal domain-containing protein [Actinoplanes sp. NPDC051851]|uniref:ketopantoate reductase family protein n=1 Tax=Actinoplanes sp. NPDC051851 TaxID=3154753 RepID=UPI003430E1D1